MVTLGREARVNPMPGTRFENWDTDESSERGIGGMERMRLVRDDIADRVADLLTRMVVDQRGCGPIIPPGLIIGPIIAGMPSLTKPWLRPRARV